MKDKRTTQEVFQELEKELRAVGVVLKESAEDLLADIQVWLFAKGSTKNHSIYETIGNFIQDIRSLIGTR